MSNYNAVFAIIQAGLLADETIGDVTAKLVALSIEEPASVSFLPGLDPRITAFADRGYAIVEWFKQLVDKDGRGNDQLVDLMKEEGNLNIAEDADGVRYYEYDGDGTHANVEDVLGSIDWMDDDFVFFEREDGKWRNEAGEYQHEQLELEAQMYQDSRDY